MKTICSLLGLIAIANASEYYRTGGGKGAIPCAEGRNVMGAHACKHAAESMGIPFRGFAGQDHWKDGRIVHRLNQGGGAFWVDLSIGKDENSHGDHDSGTICVKDSIFEDNADGYVRTNGNNPCPKVHGNDARIQSELGCRGAAKSVGLPFRALADPEHWQDGCIVHWVGGGVYWADITGTQEDDGATHGPQDSGSICLGKSHPKAPLTQPPVPVVIRQRPAPAPVKDACADLTPQRGMCEGYYARMKNEQKRKNQCAATGFMGKFCKATCCRGAKSVPAWS